MESTPQPARLFVTRTMPWLLAAGALGLFLTTASHWLTLGSLTPTVTAAGWDWTLPVGRPLVYLVGLLLKGIAGPQFVFAANIFSAVLGAVTVWLLVRCAALLPHDRTQSQRIREPSEIGLLTISLAWVPPLLAAICFTCALTVWQHATAFTGEMIDLVVFAYCVLCLVEFRLDRSEARLGRLALVYGIGVANNWAMVGYLPLFLTALAWIKGWEFFRVRFLFRLFLLGLLGVSLIFLIPAVAHFSHRFDEGFWSFVGAELDGIKGSLLGTQRGKVALFAGIMLMPFAVIGIRWAAFPDATLETISTQCAFHLAQVGWLVAGVAVMLDSKFSPRYIVISPALLTFYFCGALAVAYFAGYYLLIASRTPDTDPRGEIPLLGPVSKVIALPILAACLGVPAYFVKFNLPILRAENRGALRAMGDAFFQTLPEQPSWVLVDDPFLYQLLLARVNSEPGGADHAVIQTSLMPSPRYRDFLARVHARSWPDLARLASVTQNVAGEWISAAGALSKSNRAYFGNATYGIFAEQLDFVPRGPMYAIQAPGKLVPSAMSQKDGDDQLAFWKKMAPELDSLRQGMAAGATNLSYVAMSWSRMQDANGVELQRAGRFPDARALFESSSKIWPANASAQVNLRMNEVLAKRTSIPADINKVLENQPVLLDRYGPVDEPIFLYYYGRSLLRPQETLVRRAAVAFSRAAELAPTNRFIKLSLAESYLVLGLSADATNVLESLRRSSPMTEWTGPEQGEWFRVRALADAQLNDPVGTEASLLAARKVDPKNDQVHDALSYFYLATGKVGETTAALDQWEKDVPNSPGSAARRALLLMYQSNYAKALLALNKVLKLSADDDMARLNRAICNLMLTNLSESKSDYKLLLRKRETFQTRYGLAEVAKREGNRKEELVQLGRYLEIAPKTTKEYTNAVARAAELHAAK